MQKKYSIFDILKSSSNWNDLYINLKNINDESPKEAGRLFEVFTKLYFQTEVEAKAKFKSVWMLSDVPSTIRSRLDIGVKDYGIDLVLETKFGELFAVQCKFRNDQNSRLGWTKDSLASWLSGSLKADGRILFTNASGIDSETEKVAKRKRFRIYSIDELFKVDKPLIEAMLRLLAKKPALQTKPVEPRKDQKDAIKAVLEGFKNQSRGQLILPCGAGKTLVSLWVYEALHANRTLVLVPSLSLLKQTKDEWLKHQKKTVPYLCVCSDDSVDESRKNDFAEINHFEVDEFVTTNPKEVLNFLRKHEKSIVFSTYQSSPVIAKALRGTKLQFDLALCDEAHRTAGPMRDVFGLIHNNEEIPSNRRLYMTATPRILSPQAKAKLRTEHLKLIADMSDPEIYGPEFFRLSFKDAIDLGILVDYQIVSIMVTDREVRKHILDRRYIDKDTTIDEIANNIALKKAIAKYGITHSLTFHSRVSSASSFIERHCKLYRENGYFNFVSGQQPTNERKISLDSFAQAKQGILSNARCLTEGVDVPNIDCVFFCDPRNSIVDIVQASGRALRKPKGKSKKTVGYIIVPTFHPDSEDKEQIVDESVFGNLISVVRAMASQDQRLMDEIKQVRLAKGKRHKVPSRIVVDLDEKINLGVPFSKEALENAIHFAVIEKIPIEWRNYQDAQKYVATLGLQSQKEWVEWAKTSAKPADIPAKPSNAYKNKGWESWGQWLGTGRVSHNRRNYKSFEEARSFVRSLNLSNQNEWEEWTRSDKRPLEIPSDPAKIYKNDGWNGMGDWLGTGNIASFNRVYRTYKEAQKFVSVIGLRNVRQWHEWAKTNKPEDIPRNPSQVYENSGWVSWGEWLGTERTRNRTYLTYKEAQKIVSSLRFKNQKEWSEWFKSTRPLDIPSAPQLVYKNKGWKNLGDWLGTGRVATRSRRYRDFAKARKFVHGLGLDSANQWRAYCKSGKKPEDIPGRPWETYKDKGWISWPDWLGNKNRSKKQTFKSFRDAKKYIHALNLTNQIKWREWVKSDKRPLDIPSNPDKAYANNGWKGYSDWLGTAKKKKKS